MSDRTSAADPDRPAHGHADARAVLCSWAGTFAPSGRRVGPALDSVERLGRMLSWASDHGRLSTEGTIAQVWIVGAAAVDLLGWGVDPGDQVEGEHLDVLRAECRGRLTEAVARDLPTLERAGWRAREGWETGGAWVRLERISPRERRGRRGAGTGPSAPAVRVDVILEPYAWTTPAPSGEENLGILGDEAAGWGLVEISEDATAEQERAAEDAARAELGRRLVWCVEHLTVLPQITPSRTGAAIARRIWGEGKARNREIETRDLAQARSHILTGPVAVPPLAVPPRGDLEPPMVWSAPAVAPAELAAADRLVISDVFGSYLGSFGVRLPIGEPEYLDPTAATAALWDSQTPPDRWPVGLWAVVLPGPAQVPDWDTLPAPHHDWWRGCLTAPAGTMVTDQVTTVTTETLRGLAQTWTSGYGLDWVREHVTLLEGWVWPASAPALAKVQTVLGDALRTADQDHDRPMSKFVRATYQSYAGALSNTPEQWGKYRAEHSNPVGAACIRADARWRARRKVAAVSGRTGARPLTVVVDAAAFLVPRGMDLAMFADPAPEPKPGRTLTAAQRLPLGTLRIERWCVLTDTARERLAAAQGHEQTAAAVAGAFKDAEHVEVCK